MAIRSIEVATEGARDSFQYVLVTGLSGIVPGAIFAHLYDKQLVVVRKPGESCHGSHIEGPYDWDDWQSPNERTSDKAYIIVDDFMCSGVTLERLLEAHGNQRREHTECPGRYTIHRSKP
jgi:adenine/guanine phosphoribosyltransferase-like PRPP-binding protein